MGGEGRELSLDPAGLACRAGHVAAVTGDEHFEALVAGLADILVYWHGRFLRWGNVLLDLRIIRDLYPSANVQTGPRRRGARGCVRKNHNIRN
jgi:hypothetical protein